LDSYFSVELELKGRAPCEAASPAKPAQPLVGIASDPKAAPPAKPARPLLVGIASDAFRA
jgi:hypothetical protein